VFADELGKLAIPLGLIAANKVLQHVSAKKKKKTTASASKKRRSSTPRTIMGGADDWNSRATPGMFDSFPLSGGSASGINDSVAMGANSVGVPTMGGAAAAKRHALVAREFRRMAREIGSFLRERHSRSQQRRR
jgi:hypothetical protein